MPNVHPRPDLIDETAFVAANATVLGDVHVGARSSIWFGAVVRGDTESIEIGVQSNVQDLCVVHADPGFPAHIGNQVTIGHAAVIHGATIEDGAMIGIRAVVLNGAVVGAGALVGAGAVVTEGTVIPAGHLAVGVPAKVIKALTPEQMDRVQHSSRHYVQAIDSYRNLAPEGREGQS